jgi:transposase
VQRFDEVLNLAQHKRFSPSSETYEGDGQVFNDAEQVVETEPVADADVPETTTENLQKPLRNRVDHALPQSCRVLKCCTISTTKSAPVAAMNCTG